jgi:hypothetical protein
LKDKLHAVDGIASGESSPLREGAVVMIVSRITSSIWGVGEG